MYLSMSNRPGGAWGGDLIDRFGPGVEHLNYLAVPGIFNFFRARDHNESFPRVGNFSSI